MRTDFTAIHEALDNLIATLSEASTNLVSTANEQRVEMLTLRQRMADNAADLEELGVILNDAGEEICAIAGICFDVSEKVVAGLMDDSQIPMCDYENFVAICDNCGKDITVDEDYTLTDVGDTICAECAARLNENCDCAECTEEQIAMDIPVPVTAE
jgi:hypothetical protein